MERDPVAQLPAETVQHNEVIGASTLREVLTAVDAQLVNGEIGHQKILPTHFSPLDDVLNGGIRTGDLVILGGPSGVGKTIFALQLARNIALNDPDTAVMYICYEHDRWHLLMRLLCMESALMGHGEAALTLRRLAQLLGDPVAQQSGLLTTLRTHPLYGAVLTRIEQYADRLTLVKASGSLTTLSQLRLWARRLRSPKSHGFMVVDYLQKIPHESAVPIPENEVTTLHAQGLKELALSAEIRLLAVAAADRSGLQSRRVRLYDMRGSSAIQYEADVGIIINNKYTVVSREHIVYNPIQAEAMRNWVVFSIEKNRSGRSGVDLEFRLDASHFCMDPRGGYVHDKLIDDRLTLE
jgi:replicative DNA helicase